MQIPAFVKRPIFLWVVVLPNFLAITYFGIIASPVYRSTATIMVTSPKSNASSLSAMLSGAGADGSRDGSYLLKAHIGSWSAFTAVSDRVELAMHYANADFIGRFGGLWSGFSHNDTALWHYYQNMVHVDVDDKSGLVTLETDGYDPQFAHTVATALLAESVLHMDRMTDQQEADHLRSSRSQRTLLEQGVARDEAAIATFRSRNGVFDPKEMYASNLSLSTALASKEADLDAQRVATEVATPGSASAPALGQAIEAVRRRSNVVNAALPSLARVSATYGQLTVRRDNDVALLNQATLAAQQADIASMQNRYYLNVVSAPSSPHTPELPNRIEWIAIVMAASLLLWSLLR